MMALACAPVRTLRDAAFLASAAARGLLSMVLFALYAAAMLALHTLCRAAALKRGREEESK